MRIWFLVLIFAVVIVGNSHADVDVIRGGYENPVMTIAKSTFWGGMAGLVLGTATALAVQSDEEEIMRWFFVGGTFGGFLFGAYHVATRPDPSTALLNVTNGNIALSMPDIEMGRGETRVHLLTIDF